MKFIGQIGCFPIFAETDPKPNDSTPRRTIFYADFLYTCCCESATTERCVHGKVLDELLRKPPFWLRGAPLLGYYLGEKRLGNSSNRRTGGVICHHPCESVTYQVPGIR